jgi:hypothetical protein
MGVFVFTQGRFLYWPSESVPQLNAMHNVQFRKRHCKIKEQRYLTEGCQQYVLINLGLESSTESGQVGPHAVSSSVPDSGESLASSPDDLYTWGMGRRLLGLPEQWEVESPLLLPGNLAVW